MLQLIKNSSVSLWHFGNSIQCCLVLNSMFTKTTDSNIDTVTNLVELVRIDGKDSDHITRKFFTMLVDTLFVATTLHTWPWWRIHRSRIPNTITELSHQRCLYYSKNPQSNAVCKRMHQKVGNVLRTLLHREPPQNISNAKEYVLFIAMHAMRAGIHSTLGSSLWSLAFNRDMFLTISLIADWHAITQRQEHLINENLIWENQNTDAMTMSLNNGYLRNNVNLTNLVKDPGDHTGSCRHM